MEFLIVGLGSMGKRRARLLRGLAPDAVICGVDAAPARRAEAETLGITAFESIKAAVSARRFTAALVCTAPLSHAAIISELLDAGLPVFTELNLVADGYRENMKKAEEKGVLLFLSSTMLYRGETRYIADRVRQFDRPVSYLYHIGQYLPDWHPWENYKNFFVGDSRTGGCREIFGIELPWLLDAFGPVRSVFAVADKLSDLELPYSDRWLVTLTHENGVRGQLAVDVVCPKAVRSFEVFGEGLHLFWEGNPRELYDFDHDSGEKRPVTTYQTVEQDPRYSDNIVENAYVDELAEFLACLRGEKTARYGFAEDLVTLGVIDEIERSAER